MYGVHKYDSDKLVHVNEGPPIIIVALESACKLLNPLHYKLEQFPKVNSISFCDSFHFFSATKAFWIKSNKR